MTLIGVFQLVAAGRIEACEHHLWICPTCSWRIGHSPDPAIRDRLAMDHCLSHVYTSSFFPKSRPELERESWWCAQGLAGEFSLVPAHEES